MRPSAYIICTTPRSGSTLLCDLLTASNVAGAPRSYFRAQDVEQWARRWGVDGPAAAADPAFNVAYLKKMIVAASAGTGVFGLRLMWPSVAEAVTRLNAAFGAEEANLAHLFERHFGRTLFIHLARRDTVAQAVSLVRAEQTGLWHVAADGSDRQRTAAASAPTFDAERLRTTREMLEAEDGEWSRFFAQSGLQPLRITYEALASDPRAVLADTLTRLSLDPSNASAVRPWTRRLADSLNAEWAERLRSA